jgi:hypothetical protein
MEGVSASGDSAAAAAQFTETLLKRLQMVGTLMNNCTAVMKQHCTTNCFQTNLKILKKHPAKRV